MGWEADLHWLLMRTWVLCSPHSLGVVLSQGHGEYILLGNTSVEEGGSVASTDGQFRGGKWCSWDAEQGQPRAEMVGEPPGRRLESSLSEQGCLVRGGLCPGHQECEGPASQPSNQQSLTEHCQLLGGFVHLGTELNFTCQRTTQKVRERRQEEYGSKSVAVCSGCCNKEPQIGGFKQQKPILPQFWSPGSPQHP